jgi:hypothetical protein
VVDFITHGIVSASSLAAPLPAALPLAPALAEPLALLPPDAFVALLPDALAEPLLEVLVDGAPHAASSNANTTIGANHVLFLILFAPSHACVGCYD